MSRTAIHTIVKVPLPGTNFLLKDRKTNVFIKASSVAYRDMKVLGKTKIKHIRDISGDPPKFAVKLGSHNTKIRVINILCGEEQKEPVSEDGRFLYIPTTIRQARRKHIFFLDPGLVRNAGMLDQIMAGTVGKASSSNGGSSTAPKKSVKSPSTHRGRPKGSKNRPKETAPVIAPPVAELTLTPAAVHAPSESSPALTVAQSSISEMTLKVPETASPEQKDKISALQREFEAQVKLLIEEPAKTT